MILLDHVYYIFSNLYRKSKYAQRNEDWKFLGMGCVALTVSLFLYLFILPITRLLFSNKTIMELGSLSIVILLTLFLILFYFRYFKIKTYEKISERIKRLSSKQKLTLNIFTFIYLIITIPVCFLVIIYLGNNYPLSNS